jgi:hypothetical protein
VGLILEALIVGVFSWKVNPPLLDATCIIEIDIDEIIYDLIINVSGFTLRCISNTKENIVISIKIQVLPLGCSLQTSTEPVIML